MGSAMAARMVDRGEWVRRALQPMKVEMELIDARAIDQEVVLAEYRLYGRGRGSNAPTEMKIFDLLWLCAPPHAVTSSSWVLLGPQDCLRELLQWRDGLRVDHLIFRPFWSGMPVETALESMALLSREVIPVLREE
jgi:hypothetical protein